MQNDGMWVTEREVTQLRETPKKKKKWKKKEKKMKEEEANHFGSCIRASCFVAVGSLRCFKYVVGNNAYLSRQAELNGFDVCEVVVFFLIVW